MHGETVKFKKSYTLYAMYV